MYLEENDDEQITINHLIDFMEQKLAGTMHEAYGYTHMKMRLQEHFGNRIFQTGINSKPNMVTFRTTARAVLQEYYIKQQQQQEKTLLKRRSGLFRWLQNSSRKASRPSKHPLEFTHLVMT